METLQISKDLVWYVAPEELRAPGKDNPFPVSKPKPRVSRRRKVRQSKLILALAKMHGWDHVRKVGEGGLIDEPIETNGWLVMPRDMYKCIIPPEVMQQAEVLTNGIPIKGFLIAEDIRCVEQQSQKKVVVTPRNSPDLGKAATGLGRVAAVVAIAVAAISILPAVLAIGAIGVGLLYDPLLIAVTAEDEWVVLAEWWEKPH